MFHLPAATFWLIVPWPFIWMAFGIVMYFAKKRGDEREEAFENDVEKVN